MSYRAARGNRRGRHGTRPGHGTSEDAARSPAYQHGHVQAGGREGEEGICQLPWDHCADLS